jgi:hypothetical protein
VFHGNHCRILGLRARAKSEIRPGLSSGVGKGFFPHVREPGHQQGIPLTYFSVKAISFRPTPVKARRRYEENPNIPGLLTWHPVFADVSSAGDLGYTTGPYEFRNQSPDEQPSSYGHYVSLWKK